MEISDAGLSRRVVWLVDGEQVASRKAGEERLRITPDDDVQGLGALALRFPSLVGPTRRVTWYGGSDDLDAAAEATIGLGGLDFEPEPGSAPARREARIREHPRRYAATQTAAGVAKVVVPLLLVFLLSKLALSVDWPDLPRIPWPDLPRIPWPDIAWPKPGPHPVAGLEPAGAARVGARGPRQAQVRLAGHPCVRAGPGGGRPAPKAGRLEGAAVRRWRSHRDRPAVTRRASYGVRCGGVRTGPGVEVEVKGELRPTASSDSLAPLQLCRG